MVKGGVLYRNYPRAARVDADRFNHLPLLFSSFSLFYSSTVYHFILSEAAFSDSTITAISAGPFYCCFFFKRKPTPSNPGTVAAAVGDRCTKTQARIIVERRRQGDSGQSRKQYDHRRVSTSRKNRCNLTDCLAP